MEPITINLDGLSEFFAQFGPHGYVFGHAIAAMLFGVFAFRQIALAGKCKGKSCNHQGDAQTQGQRQEGMVGDSHIWRAAITGVVGVANVFIVIVMSANLFIAALERANPQTVNTATSLHSLSEGVPILNLCRCGMPLNEDGHCEQLIAQFGKETITRFVSAHEEK